MGSHTVSNRDIVPPQGAGGGSSAPDHARWTIVHPLLRRRWPLSHHGYAGTQPAYDKQRPAIASCRTQQCTTPVVHTCRGPHQWATATATITVAVPVREPLTGLTATRAYAVAYAS